jgi:hypothetical protein
LVRSTDTDVQRLLAAAAASAPLGILFPGVHDGTWQPMFFAIASAVVTHGGLTVWYVRRFGRVERDAYSPRAVAYDAAATELNLTPRPSPLTALAWKQFRESGPIALIGLAVIVGVTAFMGVPALLTAPEIPEEYLWAEIANLHAMVTAMFGFVIAIVLGVGVCLYEVSPKLNTFWRSRPIQPDLWFWMKFGTSAFVLMATVYIPWMVVFAIARRFTAKSLFDEEMLAIPLAHLGVFAAAAAMTCLVRHAVYAAILSIPVAFLGVIAIATSSAIAMRIGWMDAPTLGFARLTDEQFAAGVAISLAVNTIIAWLAMRYDWGQKSRY